MKINQKHLKFIGLFLIVLSCLTILALPILAFPKILPYHDVDTLDYYLKTILRFTSYLSVSLITTAIGLKLTFPKK
ncbi:hypothetical protein [Vagococcus sp.]|uniref:hypothetical protein n=1 Tax=Vagococcus sp. TaxID=1933889 RepID=UPI003F9459F6